MSLELAALAAGGASALVAAMVSDGWSGAKAGVVALWERYRPGQAETVEEALESARGELTAVDETTRQRLAPMMVGRWQGRLETLLEEHPEAAAGLATLVQQVHAGRDTYTAHRDQTINVTNITNVPTQPERVVPRQLPRTMAHFVGRAAELETLTGLLDEAAGTGGTVVISAIAGTAGIGKTVLAVYWARRVVDRFPDGQLYVNLRGFDPAGSPMRPAEAVRGFLDAFAVPLERIPASEEAQAGLYRSLLEGRRVLVVLDNARDADQVRPLLPGSPTCLVVVTSRDQLTGLVATEGAHRLTLDLLTDAEAHELLARHLGADRIAGEPEAVAELIARCARLPLALSIAAARATAHPRFPLAVLVAELRDTRGRLDALDAGDVMTDARAVFSWSYQYLSPEAARVFRLLGVHPGPGISLPAAASLTGRPLQEAHRALDELTRAHLVTQPVPGRFAFHDLLRAYATDQAHTVDTEAEQRAAVHRTLDHYLHTAHTAALLLNPYRHPITVALPPPGVAPEDLADHGQALAWFEADYPVLLAAIAQAAESGFDTHAWQLPWTLATFFDRRGHWHDQAVTQNIALAAARRLADPEGRAHTHHDLGGAHARLGSYDDADTHLRHALDLFEELGDLLGQAHTHLFLGAVCERQGRYGDALTHAQRALDLYQAAENQVGQARALNTIGWDHAFLGDHQQALTYCQQALTLQQELGDRWGEAHTWDSLGCAHHHLGHQTQATACYQYALDLWRDLGDCYEEATTLTRLGDTHHAAGDPRAARDAWRHALDILDDLGHPDAEQVRTKLARLDTTPSGMNGDGGTSSDDAGPVGSG